MGPSYGVFGYVPATTGINYGVYGRSDSSAGRRLYGEATATNGTTRGVLGRPDMMNIYNGNATTDAEGYATIELPECGRPQPTPW